MVVKNYLFKIKMPGSYRAFKTINVVAYGFSPSLL